MCAEHAEQRLSAEQYLADFGPRLFPPYFTDVLHPFFASILHTDVDTRVRMLRAAFPQIQSSIAACSSHGKRQAEASRPDEQDQLTVDEQRERGERAASHATEASGRASASAESKSIQGAGDDFRVGPAPLPVCI